MKHNRDRLFFPGSNSPKVKFPHPSPSENSNSFYSGNPQVSPIFSYNQYLAPDLPQAWLDADDDALNPVPIPEMEEDDSDDALDSDHENEEEDEVASDDSNVTG